jgi:hypothetical protein
MITYEQISALLNQAQTINDELRKATIDVLTQLGATNEQNAFSFEPAEYGETPCFYSEGHYGPIELFVTKIWCEEGSLVAILQIVNDDESWTQNLEELSVRVPYEDILCFMNLGDGKLPNSNETEEQPTEDVKKDTSRGGLIDWRTRIR